MNVIYLIKGDSRHRDTAGTIVIDQPPTTIDRVPDESGPDWEKRWRAFYREQAKQMCDLLEASLPGGTYDALLAELCERKACILRVPYHGDSSVEVKGGA